MDSDPSFPTPVSGYFTSLPDLGLVLTALRKQRGMSQRVLAERIGTVQEVVARMEREQYRAVSLERLVKVTEALGADIHIQALAAQKEK